MATAVRYLRRLKKFMPASDHPAALQQTPFNLNRYFLLCIYTACTLLSSCTYLGWGPLTSILFRHKTFIWVCSAEEQANAGVTSGPVCSAQDQDVQNLFTITYAVHFSATAIAGFLSDTAGPKVTATLGQTLNVCGWTLLGICSDSFRATLPSFVLIGAGAGMSYLPMLCVVHLFPGSTGFCLTTLGAGCSLGLLLSVLMNLMHANGVPFRWVIWNYAIVGPALSLLFVLLFVPLNGFIEVDRFVLVRQMVSPLNSAGAPPPNTYLKGVNRRSPSPLGRSSSSPIAGNEEEDRALSTVTDDEYFLPFYKEACTFLYLGLCVYFAICSIALNYYQKACSFFLSPEGFKALNTALPLSILSCIILGRVSDYISIAWVMVFVNAAGALSYLLAIVHHGGVDSVAFFSIYLGIFSSQVYIFVTTLFTSIHFGKLVGIANLVGGVASLLSNLLYASDLTTVMWALFSTMCGAFLILFLMAFAARRKMRYLQTKQILKETSRNPAIYPHIDENNNDNIDTHDNMRENNENNEQNYAFKPHLQPHQQLQPPASAGDSSLSAPSHGESSKTVSSSFRSDSPDGQTDKLSVCLPVSS